MNQENTKNCDVDILSEISSESNNTSFSYDHMSIINSLLDSDGTNLSVKNDSIINSPNVKSQNLFNSYLYLQQFIRNNQILNLINVINRYKLLQMILSNQIKNNFIKGSNNKVNNNINNGKKNISKPENEINISKLLSGKEKRCCVKLSPIPNNYSPFDIIRLIDKYLKTEKGKRIYNSIYVPLTREIGKNKGYCFVNMVSPEYVVKFYEVFNGLFFNLKNCKKPCYLVFSNIQNVNYSIEDALKRPIIFTDVIKS